jgi:protein TonB
MQRLITTFSTGVRWRLFRIFAHDQSPGRSSFEDGLWNGVQPWHGIVFSLLFHTAILGIPISGVLNREPPPEELKFVIEQLECAPAPALSGDGLPVAPAPEPEEEPEPEPPPPIPEKKPEPLMVEKAPLKPPKPKPVKKPKKDVVRPPQPVAAPINAPPMEEATEVTGTGPVIPGAPPAAGAATGGAAHHGPVEAAFGAGDGPRFLNKVVPKYPRLAREHGKEGTVLLRITIDEKGRLVEAVVVKGGGFGFDDAALRAVRESTFSPAKKDGKPIMCRASLPIQFVLRSAGND